MSLPGPLSGRARPERPRPGGLLLGAPIPWWRRSPRRAWRWFAAAGLAALAIGLVQIRTGEAARVIDGLGRTRAVAVAQRDLEPGQVISGDDTALRLLPIDALPETAIDHLPEGRIVTAAIVAGEVVSSRRLAPGGLDGLAALVPAGRRAIAVPTEGTGLRVQVDDRVDVLDPSSELSISGGSAVSSDSVDAVARGAIVIAVDDRSVTVAVTEGEARSVATALSHGTPVLALAGSPASTN